MPSRNGYGQNARMNFRKKIVAWDDLPGWRAAIRASGKRLVVTNGCFDLLHVGHVTYLETARNHGDALLLGLNGDDSVRQLKGPGRPVTPGDERAAVQPDVYVKGGDYTLDTLNQDERRAVEQAGGRIVLIPFVPGKSTTSMLKKIKEL